MSSGDATKKSSEVEEQESLEQAIGFWRGQLVSLETQCNTMQAKIDGLKSEATTPYPDPNVIAALAGERTRLTGVLAGELAKVSAEINERRIALENELKTLQADFLKSDTDYQKLKSDLGT